MITEHKETGMYGNSFANTLEQYEDPRAPVGVLLRVAGGIKMSMR